MHIQNKPRLRDGTDRAAWFSHLVRGNGAGLLSQPQSPHGAPVIQPDDFHTQGWHYPSSY